MEGPRLICSADEFVALRTSDDLAEQRRATVEPASEKVWLDVIERHPEMRVWVARNKTVPLVILERLAGDPAASVRSEVASKRKLPSALLRILARDEDEIVRGVVARHRRADLGLLRELADDDSWVVRRAARGAIEAMGSGAGP